jgi:hypothetical protein
MVPDVAITVLNNPSKKNSRPQNKTCQFELKKVSEGGTKLTLQRIKQNVVLNKYLVEYFK